jgi:hypothetical protein
MWLTILFVLIVWFAAALALGIIAGKSMAYAGRFDLHNFQLELERTLPTELRERIEVEGSHSLSSLARRTLFEDDLRLAKR